MTWYEVVGGRPLSGAVKIQGSKKGALPVLAGALLHKGRTVLHNCPRITDVGYTLEILKSLGCIVSFEKDALVLDAAGLSGNEVPGSLGEKLRSSVIFLGSLLGRAGEAILPYPGGCTIGKRPIDLHLKMLSQMGAVFNEEEKSLRAKCRRLTGAELSLPFPSVGATENVILAAVLADGVTILSGAAREPEILELCRFLRGKGARIQGDGTDTIRIEGVSGLRDSEFALGADRIVAGTYLFGGVLTRGRIFLEGAEARALQEVLKVVKKTGAVVHASPRGIFLDAREAFLPVGRVETRPYPGFPTDLQSALLSAMTLARGTSEIEEKIFEARFQTADQLRRMGADLEIKGNRALIRGVSSLHGTFVRGKELRGGAALVLAALGAEGTTLIQDDGYIERGYEDLTEDLKALGAHIHSRTICGRLSITVDGSRTYGGQNEEQS